MVGQSRRVKSIVRHAICNGVGPHLITLCYLVLPQVADKTGMVNLCLPNELGKVLQTGDIIRLTRGYCGLYKESLNVYELWLVLPYKML